MTRIGNRNVKVLKAFANNDSGIMCELTRKTMINGKIGYFVVVTDIRTGIHTKITRPSGIQKAYETYMRASGLNLNYGY